MAKTKDEFRTPKGTRDILARDLVYWNKILSKAEEVASYYGFSPIKTPHFERTNVFTSSLGEASDIVEKQMYTFRPRGGDSVTLRPEGTAPLMRAYLQHGMHSLPQPVMLYYSGSFFRHENPQKGRFREFGQFGIEILGDSNAVADAMVIRIITLIYEELGFGQYKLHINSIGDKECYSSYKKELTAYYRKKANYICKDCKRRLKTNPLRILDCTKPDCVELKQGAPQMINYLCNGCKSHFKEVLDFLDEFSIPYFLDHTLVRGLDYYSRTVFELFPEQKEVKKKKTEKKENEEEERKQKEEPRPESSRPLAVIAGGRYDYLSRSFSRKEVPATGAAMGIDRALEMLKEKSPNLAKPKQVRGFLIQLGPQAKRKSLILMEEFRKAKMPIMQSFSKNSLKSQLSIASKMGVPYALIIGQKEAADDTVMVRDMDSGVQETVPVKKIVNYLKKKKTKKK